MSDHLAVRDHLDDASASLDTATSHDVAATRPHAGTTDLEDR